MTAGPDAIVRELDGLRALARALVGGADADDLVQDTAVAAIVNPPELDRPVRPWLAKVLRNRRKMDRRADLRRQQRELAAAADVADATDAPEALDRARVLEKLSAALVALDEPYRTAIVRRYLDGDTAAAIARSLDVPAGTVRWRIKEGLDRLRAALDDSTPRWRRALLPFLPLVKGAAAVKAKTQIVLWIVLLLCIGGGGAWFVWHQHAATPTAKEPTAQATGSAHRFAKPRVPEGATQQPVADPLPGQGRAVVADDGSAGGVLRGRVINWSTGEGVAGADLGFASDSGIVTVHSQAEGAFELAPPAPTALTLATIAAPGFLPYAPELEHSSIRVVLAKGHSISGLTVFLFPALDYRGIVIDAQNQPVAGAKVRLLGTPQGEQQIDKLATEWTTGKDGAFTFHAADEAVFEATKGAQRGWARLAGDVQTTHVMKIKLGDAPARDASISGRVVDEADHPIADVLVRGLPVETDPQASPRATAFATTGPDGTFVLDHVAMKATYELFAEVEGRANVRQRADGGEQNVIVKMTSGVTLTGVVVNKADEPVPAFTLTVARRQGAQRGFELAKSVVDAKGHFEIHVEPGSLEVSAAATGWAPSDPVAVEAKPGAAPLKIVVSTGATLSGQVVDSETKQGVQFARVMREGGASGGASASPANAGTVTRADGTFELTGLPPGPVSLTIGAGEYHPKIQAGMTAEDGGSIGPITIAITKLKPGEEPTLELVGIGVGLSAVDAGLTVTKVIAGGGAAAAGIVEGDLIVAVDGASAIDLGVNGAVARIRGQAGTTVTLTVKRGDKLLPFVCERRPLKA